MTILKKKSIDTTSKQYNSSRNSDTKRKQKTCNLDGLIPLSPKSSSFYEKDPFDIYFNTLLMCKEFLMA